MFFFFKQKTAYEIYQCDWSSDVCSSDLRLIVFAEEGIFYIDGDGPNKLGQGSFTRIRDIL